MIYGHPVEGISPNYKVNGTGKRIEVSYPCFTSGKGVALHTQKKVERVHPPPSCMINCSSQKISPLYLYSFLDIYSVTTVPRKQRNCLSTVIRSTVDEKTISGQGDDNWVGVSIFLKLRNTGGKNRFR